MDNESYLKLLNSGRQEDFNKLWGELVKYAKRLAIEKSIYDAEEAAYESLNEIEEDLTIKGKMPESWGLARVIIDRNLIDYKRKDKFESVADYELRSGARNTRQGITVRDEKAGIDESIVDFRVFKVGDKHGCPKTRILELPEGNEKQICLRYWRDGFEQNEIADALNITKQYVSKVIKKHKVTYPVESERKAYTF